MEETPRVKSPVSIGLDAAENIIAAAATTPTSISFQRHPFGVFRLTSPSRIRITRTRSLSAMTWAQRIAAIPNAWG
ncbi:MAG: hypothetical protein R3F39_08355 [Myxococcota bacterium]